ncbi:hypothetical protein AVEN_244080-1 [Araneus ventricosus]|uniref:Uncharacterized protein n=1 Tax=Araneus ventricosus TaxID=182803 RepID=A0A4Y2TV45_ARAVE|nr:hypothetical protein AVEN_244080-1 [Araneus ventricosus]
MKDQFYYQRVWEISFHVAWSMIEISGKGSQRIHTCLGNQEVLSNVDLRQYLSEPVVPTRLCLSKSMGLEVENDIEELEEATIRDDFQYRLHYLSQQGFWKRKLIRGGG